MEKARPRNFRIGKLKLVEWTNIDKDGREFKSYTFEKLFLDKSGVWSSTTNFSYSDILRLRTLIDRFDAYAKPLVEAKLGDVPGNDD